MTSRYSTGMVLISLQFLLLPAVWSASFCDILHGSRHCVDNVFKIMLPVKPPDGGEVLFHPCLRSPFFVYRKFQVSYVFISPAQSASYCLCGLQTSTLWEGKLFQKNLISRWLKRSNSGSQWFVCTMKFNSQNLSAYILYVVKLNFKDLRIVIYKQISPTAWEWPNLLKKKVNDKDINTWVLITRSEIYLITLVKLSCVPPYKPQTVLQW